MPPGADTVANEAYGVGPPDILKASDDKVVQVADDGSGPQSLRGLLVDLDVSAIVRPLLRTGRTNHRISALMTGVTVKI